MEVGTYKKPQKKEDKLEVIMTPKEYKETYNPKLKEAKMKIVSSSWNNFLIGFFVLVTILALIGGGYYLYLVKEGMFKNTINQPISTLSNFNATVNNQYQLNTNTNVSNSINPIVNNNYTIPVSISVNCNSS